MNKKSLFKITGILVLALVLAGGNAYAGHGHGHGKGKGMDLDKKFFWKSAVIQENQAELGLNDDKITEIKALVLATKKNLILQKAEIEAVEVDLENELRQYPMNVQAVNDLIDRKFDLKKTKVKALVDSFAKLKSSLNAEQHNKLRELFKSGKAKGHGGHGSCESCGCGK